ncbi:MAG: hypothetical protein QW434_00750 [Pyrobaculum sp.]
MTSVVLIYRNSPIVGEVAPGVYITSTFDSNMISDNVVLVVEDRELAQKLGVGYLNVKELEAFLEFVRGKYLETGDGWYIHSISLGPLGGDIRPFKKLVEGFLGRRVAVVKDPTLNKKLGFEMELLLAPWYIFERRICGVKEAVRLAKRLAEDLLNHMSDVEVSTVLFIMANRIAPAARCPAEGDELNRIFWSSLALHLAFNKKLFIYLVYDNFSYKYK